MRRTTLKRRAFYVLAGSFAVICAVAFTMAVLLERQTPKRRIEHWLGAKLPDSSSEFHYYYIQAPGFYDARLFTRFKIGDTEYLSLMKQLGASKVENYSSTQRLPTDFNTDRKITWWNPPADQQDWLFIKDSSNGIIMMCCWSSGYAFVEKNGGFGYMLNAKSVLTN